MSAFPNSGRSECSKSTILGGRFRPQADVRDKRKTPPERGSQDLPVTKVSHCHYRCRCDRGTSEDESFSTGT